MKMVKQFTQKLDSLNISIDRKADLLSKYLNANSNLESKMNEYFEIIPPLISKKTKRKVVANNKKKIKNPEAKYIINDNYYGSRRKSFDHKARATIDIHLESDASLGKKYFSNS